MSKKVRFNKVLITGGAGYVGIPTISLLLSKGYKVRVFDSLTWRGDVLLPFIGNPKFELIKGDITRKRELRAACEGVDVVLHLAGIVGYPACRKFPELSRKVNVGGTKNLVEITASKIPIIFASTGSAYGRLIEKYCTETTPLNPLSNYGKQKVQGEKIVEKNKGEFVIYRFATAFGSAPRFRLDLLINDFTYKAVVEKTLMVYEKDFMRTFIHVRDMARAFLMALEKYDQMKGEIYNVGSESMNASKEDVARQLLKLTDFHLHFIDAGHDIDQRDYLVDYSKIRKLSFRTTVSIKSGIKELIKACDIVEIDNPYRNV